MRRQAETEHNLLLLYKISLPTVAVPVSADVVANEPSVLLLQRHNQWLLKQFVPAAVCGDGNCLFRSASLALYGNEGEHVHLRLLAAIEALLHPSLYDSSSNEYYAPYRADERLVLSEYGEFVEGLATNGSYSDMLSVLVLSSVTQKPTHTRWPILLNSTETSPMTKLVAGRGLETIHAVNMLWTTTVTSESPSVNHFVPLIGLSYDDVADAVECEAVDDGGDDDNREAATAEYDAEQPTKKPDGWPLQGHFLSNVDCVDCLCNDSYEPVHDCV